MTYHPCLNDKGQKVVIRHPHTPSPLTAWEESHAVAIVIPCGAVPEAINALSVTSWADAPKTNTDWRALAESQLMDEPQFHAPANLEPAAGVVVVEADGRVWAVAPSNAHGGYKATFPKGRVEAGMSLQATALREAYEESGLQVHITGFLIDVPRSVTYTRYYLARRVAGNPSDMGWESQAVMLLPSNRLHEYLKNSNDAPIIKQLLHELALPAQTRIGI